MKPVPISRKYSALLLCLILSSWYAAGQMPQCNKVYINLVNGLLTSDSLLTYDPALPVSATNPSLNTIVLPPNSLGLAISPALGSSSPALTYYTTSGGTFWYYDPATSLWVNTGHSIGPSTNVNIAAGGGFVYTMRGFGNQPGVYRYDGTGNAVSIATANSPLPYDLVADCQGNFYIVSNIGPSWGMRKYDSNGNFLQGYVVNNPSNYMLSGGLGMIGNTFYADDFNSKGIATGIFNGTTLDFTGVSGPLPILQAGFRVNDMATCAGAPDNLATVSVSPADTTICPGSTVTFNASGSATNAQYQWYVDGTPVTGATGTSFAYTPAGTSTVTVEMTVNGSCANMVVTSPGSQVTVAAAADVAIALPARACVGDAVQVSATAIANGTYTWNFGAGIAAGGTGAGPYAVHWNAPGSYSIYLEAQSGPCKANDTAQIIIESLPAVSLSVSSEKFCTGDTISVDAATSSATVLQWQPAPGYKIIEATAAAARILLEGNGLVTVWATNESGCRTIATLPVTAANCCRLLMPNAFSPNGDKINDLFGPVRDGHIRIVSLNIYNRWGQVVYFNNGSQADWDGSFGKTPLEAGTYFYMIRYRCDNGNTLFQQKGDLTLIR